MDKEGANGTMVRVNANPAPQFLCYEHTGQVYMHLHFSKEPEKKESETWQRPAVMVM